MFRFLYTWIYYYLVAVDLMNKFSFMINSEVGGDIVFRVFAGGVIAVR